MTLSPYVGLHYFNPVQIMKLVEVISTEHTDPAVITSVNEFVGKTGKVAVSCGACTAESLLVLVKAEFGGAVEFVGKTGKVAR